MKNNKLLRMLIFAFTAATLTGTALSVAACSNDNYLDDDPPYSFENPGEYIPEYDSSVTIDAISTRICILRSNGWRGCIPTAT